MAELKEKNLKFHVLHCSATPNGRPHNAADIDRWHKERGWDGIGYHHVICLDGKIESGRSHNVCGAHVRGHNWESLGTCIIGMDKFTRAQWASLKEHVHKLSLQYPNSKLLVVGHCDLDNLKTCPGFNVNAWIQNYWTPTSAHVLDEYSTVQ